MMLGKKIIPRFSTKSLKGMEVKSYGSIEST